MVRKLPPIAPGCPENMPPPPPNRRSKKPPCCPCSAAERYCAPQPLSPSAISSDCRCAARSVVPPLSCSCWFCRRSSALRCWSICRLRPPHCGGGMLKIEKKPELSQPLRRDCATSRSISNCWRLTASSARRIWSARAGSLLPRSSDAGRVLRLRKRADARRQRRHRYGCKLENASPHDRHSNAKIMAVRASCLMRSRSLCTQIPQHAADDDQGAEQHK